MKTNKKSYRQREKFAAENGFVKCYPYREVGSGAVRWYKNGQYFQLGEIIK